MYFLAVIPFLISLNQIWPHSAFLCQERFILLENCSGLWPNILWYVAKYSLVCGQILCGMWPNILWYVAKYFMVCGQIFKACHASVSSKVYHVTPRHIVFEIFISNFYHVTSIHIVIEKFSPKCFHVTTKYWYFTTRGSNSAVVTNNSTQFQML